MISEQGRAIDTGDARAAGDAPPEDTGGAPAPWLGEERLVREAILLVAARGAPRVLIAGIAWGEQILDDLRRPALEAGVRLLARGTSRPDRLDVLVERVR